MILTNNNMLGERKTGAKLVVIVVCEIGTVLSGVPCSWLSKNFVCCCLKRRKKACL